ncbi:MAG: IS66 family transposase [Mesoflavibacter sp.]|nr:IS66 family transposase [Mesoflavibacter sp.]
MKKPKQMKLNLDEVESLIKRVEAGHLQDGDYEIIKSMADTIVCLNQALDNKSTSIKRLLKMLFGIKTEKKDKVFKNKNSESSDSKDNHSDNPQVSGDADKPPDDKPNQKSKGHGRNGADKYTGANRQFISHQELKYGDSCPLCPKGKVYKLKIPGVVVRISAQAPMSATIYDLEKLRCNLCGEVFTAIAPGGITGKHYDESAKAMISILKYGCGFPWYRMEKLQESLGVPLPASTQWDKIESAADLIYPVFDELKRQAAQGSILHNDDTPMKILELMEENKTKSKKDRTGIFTTGIISVLDEDKKIALFFTGRNHAGENIGSLYQIRDQEKGPPIQMCDALSRNASTQFETIMANCLTHGRRGFVDVAENFPDECRYVIEVLAEVYKIDDKTKKQSMSSEKRLKFHQLHSGPLMEELNIWLNKQIDDKLVEPNSGLGQAISYMLNHWPELTQFLRVAGAPLDNNICEQALKRAILHRKNALFYKTQHGAYIGDLFMSLIHTCNLMKINPFKYLVALQKYSVSIFKNPSRWMPWNYKKALTLEV